MLTLPQRCFSEIVAHADEEYPKECCGIAIGTGSDIQQVLRGRNTLDSPYEYSIHPDDLLNADNLTRQRGWEIIGFYHSHTGIDATRVVEAYPSQRDISGSKAWPDAAYLIVSLADRANPVLRAFRIEEGQVQEIGLQLLP